MKKSLVFASGVLTGIGLTAVGEWLFVKHKVKNLVSDVEDITNELLSDEDDVSVPSEEEVISSNENSPLSQEEKSEEKSEGGVSDEKKDPSGNNS